MKKPYIPKPIGAKKSSNRANFTAEQKRKRLEKQKDRCANPKCRKPIKKPLLDWDHKDGNRSNNSFSNCQALCLPCHRLKSNKASGSRTTRKKISDGKKSSEAKKPPTLSKQLRKDKFRPFKI